MCTRLQPDVLFNINMKLLGAVSRSFGVKCHQYAEDTKLYLSCPSESEEVVKVLDQCMDVVMAWMRAYEWKLKPEDKGSIMCPMFSYLRVVLHKVALSRKERICSLGLLLNSTLKVRWPAPGPFARKWLGHCSSCSGNFQIRLQQCALCGPALEVDFETSIVPKCNSPSPQESNVKYVQF